MQIVISISNSFYDRLKDMDIDNDTCSFNESALVDIIQNGTPLPKGHGDLIDRNEIEYIKAIYDMKWGKITASECATKIKYSAPTIIEADRGEKNRIN